MESNSSKKSGSAQSKSTYFIEEKNLLMWLFIILAPFFIAIIIAISDIDFAVWMPSFSMYQCGDWVDAY